MPARNTRNYSKATPELISFKEFLPALIFGLFVLALAFFGASNYSKHAWVVGPSWDVANYPEATTGTDRKVASVNSVLLGTVGGYRDVYRFEDLSRNVICYISMAGGQASTLSCLREQ